MLRLNLYQPVVYWPRVSADRYGQPGYDPPQSLTCRWEGGVTQSINAKGDVVMGAATVYLATDVTVDGLLLLNATVDGSGNVTASPGGQILLTSGATASRQAAIGIREVVSVSDVPSLKNRQKLVTAIVK